MHATLILTNHRFFHIQDFVDYLRAGFRAAGVDLRVGFWVDPTACATVCLENFEDRSFCDWFTSIKTSNPEMPLIVVATEVLVNGVFNSAMADGREVDTSYYSDLDHWRHRSQSFFEVAPHVDLFLCAAEEIHRSFLEDERLAGKSQYLPFVWFDTFATRRPNGATDQDIDFFFSGTTTEHRQRLMESLVARQYRTFFASNAFPEYLRHHFLQRTKVYLGLKHYPQSVLLSKMRAYWALTNGYFAAFEGGTSPCDLDRYLITFSSIDHLTELWRLPRATRDAIAAQRLAAFAAAGAPNPFALALERVGVAVPAAAPG